MVARLSSRPLKAYDDAEWIASQSSAVAADATHARINQVNGPEGSDLPQSDD
jgi:hypothetical protein